MGTSHSLGSHCALCFLVGEPIGFPTRWSPRFPWGTSYVKQLLSHQHTVMVPPYVLVLSVLLVFFHSWCPLRLLAAHVCCVFGAGVCRVA